MNSNAAVLEDDLVTLGEFVEFWWASEVPWEGLFEPGDRYDAFIHRKQSAVRMLRQGREGFPTPAGHRGRAQLFRLGDLMTWGPLQRKLVLWEQVGELQLSSKTPLVSITKAP